MNKIKQKYAWPAERPNVPMIDHGWFPEANQLILGPLLSPATTIICEVGSWMGKSALFFAQKAPNATVFCIDHWLGSAEHHMVPDWAKFLPTLYETFLTNLWDYRDRVVPMRTHSLDGLEQLHAHNICPQVCYIDGAHDEDSVYNDVSMALRYFPEAWIVGDDWSSWESVRKGVERCLAETSVVFTPGVCWTIEPRRPNDPNAMGYFPAMINNAK